MNDENQNMSFNVNESMKKYFAIIKIYMRAAKDAFVWTFLNTFFGLFYVWLMAPIFLIEKENLYSATSQFVFSSFALILFSVSIIASIGTEIIINDKFNTRNFSIIKKIFTLIAFFIILDLSWI